MSFQSSFFKFRKIPAMASHVWWMSLVCTLLIFPMQIAAQESPRTHPSLLQRFWDIGCEFSGVVTRVRRSTDNPPAPEPNFDDPEELFNYLYPLANVNSGEKAEAANGESQRSSISGTHSISSWLEDLMELWHSECHHRREKRSAERMAANRKKRASGSDGRLRRKEYAWLSNGKRSGVRNSSLANSMRRQGYEDDDGYDHYNRDEAILEEVEEMEEDKLEEEKDKDKEKEKDKLNALIGAAASLIPPKPNPQKPGVNLPSMADNKQEEIFFSQYGGDIEYFFPLLSFGIPFDGEITLLGFHGFRGIFPY